MLCIYNTHGNNGHTVHRSVDVCVVRVHVALHVYIYVCVHYLRMYVLHNCTVCILLGQCCTSYTYI